MNKLVINLKEYSWGSIKVFLFGKLVTGITKIEYKEKREKSLRYGYSNSPHSVQHGKYSVEGSIELSQSEITALNLSAKAAGYSSILDVDFDIVVVYEEGLVITTDTIKQASFSEIPKAMASGDSEMKVAVPFVALAVHSI